MLNKAVLIGRLGRDPETRRTNSGDPVVSFGLATSERWKDKATGERKERTEWHNVVIFNEHLGRVAEQYLKKGSKVHIEGKIQSRKYTAADGTERVAYEIVLQRFAGEMTLLDDAGSRPAADADSYGSTRIREGTAPPRSGGGEGRPSVDLDDDIPFGLTASGTVEPHNLITLEGPES